MKLSGLPMYCLNLDRRPDRKLRAWTQFRRHRLDVERLAAPDADGLREARGWMTPGIRACCAAHRLAWRRAARTRANAVIVFEDDVILCDNFRERLMGIHLPDSWDVFYFGCMFEAPGPVSAGDDGLLRIAGRTWDNHAYAIRLPFARIVAQRQAVLSRRNRPARGGARPANDGVMAEFHSTRSAWSVWPPMAWQVEGLSNNFGGIRGNYRPDGRQRYLDEVIAHLPWKEVTG